MKRLLIILIPLIILSSLVGCGKPVTDDYQQGYLDGYFDGVDYGKSVIEHKYGEVLNQVLLPDDIPDEYMLPYSASVELPSGLIITTYFYKLERYKHQVENIITTTYSANNSTGSSNYTIWGD